VAAGEGGLANYDTDDGVPTGFDAAVVPIICEADELADFDTP
jgi:hypothetical protein